MKKILAVAALLLALSATPALAVTDGTEDGNGHPQVVLLLMEVDGQPMYRCSGTLLSPTFVLTAGHCTSNYPDAPYSGMRVFTESDVENGTNNYPLAGPNSVEAVHWWAHPKYDDGPWFKYDVGLVELAEPINLSAYGTLPEVDSLDQYAKKRGHSKVRFDSVGYGRQKSFPYPISTVKNEAFKVRMIAHPRLVQINAPGFTGDFSLLLSNNANTGGTCFGDSGGPNFLEDSLVVAGVTSFGLNGTCGGTGGVFRMDRQGVQDFINGLMD